MKLYLVQHARAAPTDIDPDRSLTKEGLRDIRKVAEFIKPLNLHVEYLWHSRKKRAEQTADVLAETLKADKGLAARDGLAPNDDVTALASELDSTIEDIAIVGHLPFLGKLASLLLAGSESADTVAFKNGGIVCLTRSDENQWHIDWMVTPELLA